MLETAIPLDQADVRLYEGFLRPAAADFLFDALIEKTEWHQPEISMYGRTVKSPRLAAWYGDQGAFYTYSGLSNYPKPWLPELQRLKHQLGQFLSGQFNSVLINMYRTGEDAMGWHSDDEPELGDRPVIASLSLGASRRFLFRQKKTERRPESTRLTLDHGSLLVMAGETQRFWQHSISRTRKQIGPRVNLTFRMVCVAKNHQPASKTLVAPVPPSR